MTFEEPEIKSTDLCFVASILLGAAIGLQIFFGVVRQIPRNEPPAQQTENTQVYSCPEGGRHLGRIHDGSWAMEICLEPDEPTCPSRAEHMVGNVYYRGMLPGTKPQQIRIPLNMLNESQP